MHQSYLGYVLIMMMTVAVVVTVVLVKTMTLTMRRMRRHKGMRRRIATVYHRFQFILCTN